jgi:hypothetical protein
MHGGNSTAQGYALPDPSPCFSSSFNRFASLVERSFLVPLDGIALLFT